MNEAQKKALMALLNDPQLDTLEKRCKQFNLFDTLKISTMEIRHSNMLAWLLDPNENHGLKDSVLREVILELSSSGPPTNQIQVKRLNEVEVLREHWHTDILIISKDPKFVICIENKVFSGEHDQQLTSYRNTIEAEFPDYVRKFIYLTPDGSLPEEPEEQEHWMTLGYERVIRIVEEAVQEKELPADVEMVIRHYIDAVRRHIVGDKEIEELCKKIYQEHRDALERIFEYRSNETKLTAEKIKEWCREKANEGEIEFKEDDMEAKVGEIAFTTSFMTAILPGFNERKSGWKDKNMYHYAIFNKDGGKSVSISLVVSGKNISSVQDTQCRRLAKHIGVNKEREENWQWWTLKRWKVLSIKRKSDLTEEEYKEKLLEGLDRALKEIKEFEQGIKI